MMGPLVTIDPEKDFVLLVAGSRILNNYNIVAKGLEECTEQILEKFSDDHIVLVEGEAKGVDQLARRYAECHGWRVIPFPANWNQHGKRAGFVRNEKMHKFISQYPNRLCICFKHHDSDGKGTTHSIELGEMYHNDVLWNEVFSSGTMQQKYYHNNDGGNSYERVIYQ